MKTHLHHILPQISLAIETHLHHIFHVAIYRHRHRGLRHSHCHHGFSSHKLIKLHFEHTLCFYCSQCAFIARNRGTLLCITAHRTTNRTVHRTTYRANTRLDPSPIAPAHGSTPLYSARAFSVRGRISRCGGIRPMAFILV